MATLKPIWIETADGVKRVAARCRQAGSCAVDTEADSFHSYFHKLCLIQVTVEGEHWLLDPLALDRNALAPFVDVLADPSIRIVMHGADYDIRIIDRDLDGRVHGLEDTQIMAQLLGERRTGLSSLLSSEVGVELEKKYQKADWGRRPLTAGMIEYAAADTAWLAELATKLGERLRALGRWSWAEEEFARLEQVRHEPSAPDPLAFERVKGVSALKGKARDRAAAVYAWRDEEAQRRDQPPFRVLSNATILDLAAEPPASLDELAGRRGIGRGAKRWGRSLLAAVTDPEPAPARRRGRRVPRLEPAERKRVRDLQRARDALAEELALDPGVLCPKATLVELATCELTPRSAADLGRCGLEGWRFEVAAERFWAALDAGG